MMAKEKYIKEFIPSKYKFDNVVLGVLNRQQPQGMHQLLPVSPPVCVKLSRGDLVDKVRERP